MVRTLNRYHQNGWNQKKSSFGIEDNQFLLRKVNSEFEAGNYHKANIPGHAVRVKDMSFEHRYEARNGHRTNNPARTMWMEDTPFKHNRFEARNGHKERFPAQAIIEDMSFEEHRRWDADAVFHRQEFDNGFNRNGFKKIECIPKAV
ncbi:hypothetical protein K2173_011789 [Erythroxylum novogranatense]|uniref:Uncharacterized protein n=1 Tax=Erythroxylum novogranatense TaxID=1862640 RepID=A0AAV8S5A8_9ROSI|nr:hypothetical protein K2173_011789 [Erythroxylum novogranatense]